jgi:hypothetical protein
MNALCRAYENTADAERAVEALLAAGVAGDDVRLLMSAEMHDARRSAKGRRALHDGRVLVLVTTEDVSDARAAEALDAAVA